MNDLGLLPYECYRVCLSISSLQCRCQSQLTGTYFVDFKNYPSVPIDGFTPMVFDGVATRGKSSTGWFFGLKLHRVINQLGQPVSFLSTPSNVADNNHQVIHYSLDHLQGHCIGD